MEGGILCPRVRAGLDRFPCDGGSPLAMSLLNRRYRRLYRSAHTVTELRAESNYTLWLRFDDGVEGHVYLADLLGTTPFVELGSEEKFCRVAIDPISNNIMWEGGIHIDTEALYRDIMSKAHAPLH